MVDPQTLIAHLRPDGSVKTPATYCKLSILASTPIVSPSSSGHLITTKQSQLRRQIWKTQRHGNSGTNFQRLFLVTLVIKLPLTTYRDGPDGSKND